MKLIIRVPNWVGDAVMAIPTVDNARDYTGADHITILARPATAPLFRNHPDVDEVIEIDDKTSRPTGLLRSARILQRNKFDLGYLLTNSLSSAMIFKLGGVKERIGYAADKRTLLLSTAVAIPDAAMHRARSYQYLFEIYTETKLSCRPPRLYFSALDENLAAEVLQECGIDGKTPFICVAPQAIAESRRWGIENYGLLANALIRQYDCPVLLLGTTSDREAAEGVRGSESNIHNLCGHTNLMTAAAILAKAALFIGNDSGLAHLSAAAGAPMVVLSGPDNPEETSPLSDDKDVIIKELHCISCVKNACPKTGSEFMRCMKMITVDEVVDAASHRIKI